jgi:hypothetical protein
VTPAERQRECRRRRGVAVFQIEAEHDPLVIALLETGRITESAALDRAEVEKATAPIAASA